MVIEFIITGVLISVAIWLFQRRTRLSIVVFVGLITIVLGAISFMIYLLVPPTTLSEQSWYNKSPYFWIIIYLLMILGMIARYVTRAIEERNRKYKEMLKEAELNNSKITSDNRKPIKKPSIEFDIWDFAYPMLFSVMTYGLLIADIENQTLTVTNVVLSFQTGFLWHSLLSDKLKD